MVDDCYKEFAQILQEDVKKFGVIENGYAKIKSPLQEQIIGKVKNKKEEIKEMTIQEKDEMRIVLNQVYNNIKEIIEEYCDLREEYFSLASIWILGTYLHEQFDTFPYLFINASRGSGKTRLQKIIAELSHRGRLIGSPTEAVLFRLPKGITICIDEFEGILRKGNEGIREILNASYKKGMSVFRLKKQQTQNGSEHILEEFEPYRPICLANIYGMEEVLGDRCITLILEKSGREDIMRIVEDFSKKPLILSTKASIDAILVQLCSYFGVREYIKGWNKYVKDRVYITTQTTQHTDNTLIYTEEPQFPMENECSLVYKEEELDFFNKIWDTGINGRNLELFFPLLIIAKELGGDAMEDMLKIATTLTYEKKAEEMVESKDIALIDFISQLDMLNNGFVSIKIMTNRFRAFVGDIDEKEDKWINDKWLGRAIKRLNLIQEKRRMAGGIEVILNIARAKEKIRRHEVK